MPAPSYSVPGTADTSRTQRTTRDNLNGTHPTYRLLTARYGRSRRRPPNQLGPTSRLLLSMVVVAASSPRCLQTRRWGDGGGEQVATELVVRCLAELSEQRRRADLIAEQERDDLMIVGRRHRDHTVTALRMVSAPRDMCSRPLAPGRRGARDISCSTVERPIRSPQCSRERWLSMSWSGRARCGDAGTSTRCDPSVPRCRPGGHTGGTSRRRRRRGAARGERRAGSRGRHSGRSRRCRCVGSPVRGATGEVCGGTGAGGGDVS